jgi:hypothetical protein
MIVAKVAPKGVDYVIDKIQNGLNKNLNWTNYTCNHRAYKNEKDGAIIAELYTRNGNYTDCLFDDKLDASSFFLVDDSKKIKDGVISQRISIIFQLKLNKQYPTVQHRADEEAHNDVYNALCNAGYRTYIDEVITGASNVYNDLKLGMEWVDLYKFDISSKHIFKVDLTLRYSVSNCNTYIH